MKSFSLFLLLFCATVSAQETGKLSLDVRAGLGTFTTFDDFQTIVYTIEGSDYNRSEGNVAESDILPNLYFGLNYQMTDRLQLAPFANYLFGSGTHYENDFVRFGITDINPVEQTFRAPAEFEMKALTVGAEIRYKLVATASHSIYVGTGIAYTTRSHYYRFEMDVDFGADFIAQRVDQRFTTANKSGMTLPLVFGLERPLSDRLTITLDVRALIQTNSEDKGWNGGVGARWSL
ncbi:MAG: outer membrane beta-barrel protein [Lewinella sp.]